jgi:2-polyprenyl-3-methyl-5-hydroxy-6-metoxy-1,4-benzoquinol methylase
MAAFDEARRDAFVEKVFKDAIAVQETLALYLGERLGLYRALEGAPATAAELAEHGRIDERYAREWLEQQAVAGVLDVTNPEAGDADRRFQLPAEHAEVLLHHESLNYLAPLARLVVSLARPIEATLGAYRTGGGVPWSAFGVDAREGQAAINRPAFQHLLTTEWLAALPDVRDRLARPGVRVADIACGDGWSSIALAQAFPSLHVDGYELDGASVAAATLHALESGVSDRVRVHLRDASDPSLIGRYDMVTIFEALHDMSRPVEVLQVARGLLADGGALLIVDENVAETFTAPGDEIERMMYGWSVLMCLPAGMADRPTAATGTVLRPNTVRRFATEAGFRSVTVLPVEHDFFRLYRLDP